MIHESKIINGIEVSVESSLELTESNVKDVIEDAEVFIGNCISLMVPNVGAITIVLTTNKTQVTCHGNVIKIKHNDFGVACIKSNSTSDYIIAIRVAKEKFNYSVIKALFKAVCEIIFFNYSRYIHFENTSNSQLDNAIDDMVFEYLVIKAATLTKSGEFIKEVFSSRPFHDIVSKFSEVSTLQKSEVTYAIGCFAASIGALAESAGVSVVLMNEVLTNLTMVCARNITKCVEEYVLKYKYIPVPELNGLKMQYRSTGSVAYKLLLDIDKQE